MKRRFREGVICCEAPAAGTAVPLRSGPGGPGRDPPVTAVTSDGALLRAVSRVEPWSFSAIRVS